LSHIKANSYDPAYSLASELCHYPSIRQSPLHSTQSPSHRLKLKQLTGLYHLQLTATTPPQTSLVFAIAPVNQPGDSKTLAMKDTLDHEEKAAKPLKSEAYEEDGTT